ncbi:ATP-binding protein [Nonomuraea jabiensis]|uniref:ATP-binding protein n=1 Tax=Nonomuraea jabiensis TaxID=882448 RepID=UPI00342311AC
MGPVLVGRQSHRAAISAAYRRARSCRPVTVLVSGEAGVGKSRLVDVVTRELPGEPLAWPEVVWSSARRAPRTCRSSL